jgi:hypothetical protein
MAWVRFDDSYREHPKIVYAGRQAREIHEAMIFYSARNLTDGLIHENQIPVLAAYSEVKDWRAALKRLMVIVDGFDDPLVHAEPDGWYRLHDYHDYQPTKQEVVEERDRIKIARSEAGKRGMESRWGHNKPDNKRDNKTPVCYNKTITNGYQTDNPGPVPESRIPNPDSLAMPESVSHTGEEKPSSQYAAATTGASREARTAAAAISEGVEGDREREPHPTIADVRSHFRAKGWSEVEAGKFHRHFEAALWIDSKGRPVVNWRRKASDWINRALRDNPNADKPDAVTGEPVSRNGHSGPVVVGKSGSLREQAAVIRERMARRDGL